MAWISLKVGGVVHFSVPSADVALECCKPSPLVKTGPNHTAPPLGWGGAAWLGPVFTNGDGLEHFKATPVRVTLKCTTPMNLSEIRAILFSIKFLSTLDAPHVTPKMAF